MTGVCESAALQSPWETALWKGAAVVLGGWTP